MSKGFILLIFVIAICLQSASAVWATELLDESKNILVIHSYYQGFFVTDAYDQDISDAFLRTSYELSDIYTEYMDVDRIDYNNDYTNFAEYITTKYKDIDLDGVICVGEEAYGFVNDYYHALFEDVVVLHMNVDIKNYTAPVSTNIVGVNQEVPFDVLFKEAKRLNPELKKIDIYTNSPLVSTVYEPYLKALSSDYDMLYQVHSDTLASTYLEDILDKEGDQAVILLSDLFDESGVHYTRDYLFDIIDRRGSVPVLATENYYVGKGAVGAVCYDQFDYIAKSIGLLINKSEGLIVDDNTSASSILTAKTLFDYSKLMQLGLETDIDDRDVTFINRPSFVETIQNNSLEFIILALIIITVILVFSVTNLLLRLKAEKDREDVRKDLQLSYMELEAAHEQLVASEGELTRQFRELQKKEDELRKSRERYRLAAKGAEFGIWDFDIPEDKIYFSNKAKEILGLPLYQNSFTTAEFYGLFDIDQELTFRKMIDTHLKRYSKFLEYEANLNIDNEMEWISIRGKALFNEEDIPTRIAGSLSNITSEKKADEKLYQIAFYDELTGLNNKAYFNGLMKELAIDKEHGQAALLLIDLDNFKTINDSLGHNYGDEVLKKIAVIIDNMIGEEHHVIRFGGDEFIVLLNNYGEKEVVEQVAVHLLETFRKQYDVDGVGFSTTLSIGIAMFPDDSDNFDSLLKRADLALNEAKDKGRNRLVYYDHSLEEIMISNLWYERELKNAIALEQFELYYQPQYNIRTDKVTGYEALIRWNHPDEGLISPAEFIPIAEENGLIIKIGEWVIQEAIEQLDKWHQEGYDYLTMSINLSAKQFKEINLEDVVHTAMAGKRIQTSQIELEITETTALHDIEYATQILDKFRSNGFKVALDDFGTGYSSLNYLNTLPIDTLKIDKTFIANSIINKSGKQIIKTVIQLAHAHDMQVVAEGVETIEQLTFLKGENCDVIQGYYISKPLMAEAAIGQVDIALELV